jgi:O-antigen ligase
MKRPSKRTVQERFGAWIICMAAYVVSGSVAVGAVVTIVAVLWLTARKKSRDRPRR